MWDNILELIIDLAGDFLEEWIDSKVKKHKNKRKKFKRKL